MISRAALGRYSPLNLFRSAAARRNIYQHQASTAPLCTARSRSSSPIALRERRPSTGLFARRARAGFAVPTGATSTNGTTDSAALFSGLQRGNSKAVLEVLRQTASNHSLQRNLETGIDVSPYQGDLILGFHEKISSLPDGALTKLHARLNNKTMRELRGGLATAAAQGLGLKRGEVMPNHTAVRVEFGFIQSHFENLNRMIVAEMSGRGLSLQPKDFQDAPPLGSWQRASSTQKTLLRFGEHISGKVATYAGAATRAQSQEIKEDFTKLCFEAQTLHARGKEQGVRRLKMNDQNSPELNVSDLYVVDFSRGDVRFTSQQGSQTNRDLGWSSSNPQELSDHMTDFCAPTRREISQKSIPDQEALSQNQARRVQAVMTQQTLAPIYMMQATGQHGSPPESLNPNINKETPAHIGGGSYHAFDVHRQINGDVQVNITQRIKADFVMYEGMRRENIKEDLNVNRSHIEAKLQVLIPRAVGAAPVVESFTYDSHLVTK